MIIRNTCPTSSPSLTPSNSTNPDLGLKEFAAKEKLEIVKVQDFGSEFLARPSPPQAAKCVRTILRIDHQTKHCRN